MILLYEEGIDQILIDEIINYQFDLDLYKSKWKLISFPTPPKFKVIKHGTKLPKYIDEQVSKGDEIG